LPRALWCGGGSAPLFLPRFSFLTRAAALLLLQDNAQALGVNVVRTWAFCDGNRAGALQPQAGVYSEATFQALDSVIAQARDRNVRLLLVLTNNWKDYGAPPAGTRVPRAL